MALVNWTLSEVMKRGFTPLTTPEIVRSSVVEKCGFQPRANNTQVCECVSLNNALFLKFVIKLFLTFIIMDIRFIAHDKHFCQPFIRVRRICPFNLSVSILFYILLELRATKVVQL